MKRLGCAMLAGGLAIALAMPVAAQGPGDGPPRGGAMARGPIEHGQARPDPAAMRAREAGDLALVLGLTTAQRPALDAFLAAGAPPARPDGPPPAMPAAGATPPGFEQRLAMMQTRATERNAAEVARIAAARTFYSQLDARQKPVFDALMRLRRGPGGPGGPGEHGPPGGPDMMPR